MTHLVQWFVECWRRAPQRDEVLHKLDKLDRDHKKIAVDLEIIKRRIDPLYDLVKSMRNPDDRSRQ
jgi:hypothetical protein